MGEFIARIPVIDWALALAILLTVLVAIPAGKRGGRYRGLPGWAGFCVMLGVMLLALAYAPRWLSFPLLGLLRFVALRGYFSVAPVRSRDRYAVLASYLAIPFALWPAYLGSHATFLATVPISLFLFIPVFIALGRGDEGMLNSMGRTLLGVLFFVFCTGHVGLLIDVQPTTTLAGQPASGLPQLFGVLVLASELPRRIAGDFGSGAGRLKPILGVLIGLVLVVVLGSVLGERCGLIDEDGGRVGVLVLAAVTLGALVSNAVADDLAISSSSSLVGRGAFLSRMVPAVYAAPVYFHYLNTFA